VGTEHVRLLGAVRFVTGRGEVVDLPSASQCRLLVALVERPDHRDGLAALEDALALAGSASQMPAATAHG
jgi:hypothetical protein